MPERNRGIEIFPTDTDIGAPGRGLQFLKRGPERLFERGSLNNGELKLANQRSHLGRILEEGPRSRYAHIRQRDIV